MTKKIVVSVITRTKDRLIFLIRAYQSILKQDFKNVEWIIVNDGGNKLPLESFIENKGDSFPIRLVNLKSNLGRSAAANKGIQASIGEYIVLHDDDDSWDPQFLSKTVKFLEENEHYVAVNTHAIEITEKLSQGEMIVKNRKLAPFNTDHITFLKMATFNPVSTIGCLFRMNIYCEVGGFDETLPVLEDYDFFLRVLCKGDIGTISDPLANYHIRHSRHDNPNYDNTVTTGEDWHKAILAKYRNYHIRKALQEGKIEFGHILLLGESSENVMFIKNSWIGVLKVIKKLTGYAFFRRRIRRK